MTRAAFDEVAADYDAAFTRTKLGSIMRTAVWARLESCFHRGERVLELTCGTGEDAVHLAKRGVSVLATDGSPSMLAVAREKVEAAGVADSIVLQQLDLEGWSDKPPGAVRQELDLRADEMLDGALSNFGGLNCVEDLTGVRRGLAQLVRPGGRVVLCVMGPYVPWEWGWFLLRAQPRTAFRRLRGATTWRGMTVRYPSIRMVRRVFEPSFRFLGASALGALLPPPYAESWAQRHPSLVRALNRWERRWEGTRGLASLADHFVLELERVRP